MTTLLNLSEAQRQTLISVEDSYRKGLPSTGTNPYIVRVLRSFGLVVTVHYKDGDALNPTPLGSSLARLLSNHYVPPRSSPSKMRARRA
jgi:hypothetical protein